MYSNRVDHPKGDTKNRMTEEEIRGKFLECAVSLMTTEQVDRVIDTCMHLDSLKDIGELMPLLVLEQ